MNPELFEFAKNVQTQKLSVNEVWSEIIDQYLVGKNETTMGDILRDCLKVEIKELQNRAYTINVGRILKKLGFEKKDRTLGSGKRYFYVREDFLAKQEKKRIYNEEEE